MMEIIKVENVTYAYKQYESAPLEALKGITLSINEGEFVALVGANGSGKSTLAKHLNGLLVPKSGDVFVFGHNTRDDKNIYEIRKNVGVVFQNPDNQMVANIVEDDVAFGPENLGVPRDEIERRITWALDVVNMTEYRHSTPHNMSGGQKQRIAIAGVLAMKPRVLVLDESTSMLDPEGRREVMDVVKKLNEEEGITVVHITHHMDEVVNCDRVIVMDKGRIVLQDTPKALFKRDVSQYKLTLPLINQIADRLKSEGVIGDDDVMCAEDLVDCLCR
ncbi:MAG: energy-coupling factor transporter ATPase [Christensenellaceae bacterium]|nr:energy-coupling factor transporter ATPase [Christensenellaceae bacterium]MCI7769265.1 energy-coupling factor transporter ATPase [Christensenellaceae bacterium]MDD6361040.1 energy-coupling factor transporter ATPase [Christensenellaceae bacterium]MDD7092427.1 energy-coupling factor transporter ATPase [Christensenellaceae bacterium]